MKYSILILMLGLAGSLASAENPGAPQVVNVPLRQAYIPGGFDSNDVVQFVVEGYFPNSCYRPRFTSVQVRPETRTIEVSQTAFRYSGLCLEVIIPFDQVITVGVLEAGAYKIVQPSGRVPFGDLNVRAAIRAEPDDFLYAPVSQAYFQARGGGAGEVVVSGEFATSCMSLESLRVSVEPRAIVVQPIAKMETAPNCIAGRFPFQRSIALRGKPGRYVLHVRSMNGKAVNTLVDIL